ncbi:MAG: hypothetical protein EOP19_19410 [Hyphomicrobiales bacterium]|nr:MAG: hypothetical protein EOP19_19410 [Hyphomicrobiales bacterium]
MTSKTALFALLAMWGVGSFADAPAMAEEAGTEARADQTPLKRSFTNRVWVKAEADDSLPGQMVIFLSDGTLVQDSCWETHRLSNWTMSGDAELSWNEDGMDIPASIVSVSSTELHLQLTLGSDKVDQHYVAATVPYVCPDMPK